MTDMQLNWQQNNHGKFETNVKMKGGRYAVTVCLTYDPETDELSTYMRSNQPPANGSPYFSETRNILVPDTDVEYRNFSHNPVMSLRYHVVNKTCAELTVKSLKVPHIFYDAEYNEHQSIIFNLPQCAQAAEASNAAPALAQCTINNSALKTEADQFLAKLKQKFSGAYISGIDLTVGVTPPGKPGDRITISSGVMPSASRTPPRP